MKSKLFITLSVSALSTVLVGCGASQGKRLCELIEQNDSEAAIKVISEMRNVNVSEETVPWLNSILTQGEGSRNTPLETACRKGNLEVMEALLDAGADPNYTVTNNSYPLEAYCESGYPSGPEGIQMLIDAGAKVDLALIDLPLLQLVYSMTYTPGEMQQVIFDDVKCLVENGASLKETRNNHPYVTAVHYAAKVEDTSLLVYLLETDQGRELVNEKDYKGSTPLHYAAKSNNVEACKILIEAGADPTMENDNGESALW